jgi:hypothetical protein
MLLHMQTLMVAQATLVSKTPTPTALAQTCLSLALATCAPARMVHTEGMAAAVCTGDTLSGDVLIYNMACMHPGLVHL